MALTPNARTARRLATKYASDFLTVDCGAWTYGGPRLHVSNADYPRVLRIGRYCSIASGVEIFIGRQGRHALDTMTSYPLGSMVSAAARAQDIGRERFPDEIRQLTEAGALQQLDVEIGHDVWLGSETLVLAGVKIGTVRLWLRAAWSPRTCHPTPLSVVFPPRCCVTGMRRTSSHD